MARYRRTRKYTRSRRNKWSPNIQEIRSTSIIVNNPNGGVDYVSYVLAFNPIQTNTAVSQIYTVKNFDINFIFEIPSDDPESPAELPTIIGFEDVCAYIMFVPQGMNVTPDYNIQHPEYIMAHKFVGSPSVETISADGQQYQPYRVKTRLSRKLNTGDSVILFIKYNYQAPGLTIDPPRMSVSGLARWWTKAN